MISAARRAAVRMADARRGQGSTVRTADGFRLQVRAHPADGSRACILAAHGITSDSSEDGMFTALAREANARSVSLVRFDFRGHGRSEGSDRDFDLEGQRRDLEAAIEHAREMDLGPVVIVGMSFGASAAVEAASRGETPALVLWSPVVDYERTCMRAETPWAGELLATREEPELPDWAFARIPQTRFHISDVLARQCEADRTPDLLAGLGVPVLAFSARGDAIVPFEAMAEVAARADGITFRPLPEGTEHGLHAAKDEVVGGTMDWIESRIGG